MTPDIIGLLGNVIEEAQRILGQPFHQVGASMRLRELRPLVEAQAQKPAPDGRFVGDEARMLMTALDSMERRRAAGDHWGANKMRIVGGVLLPMVQEDLGRALEAAARPVETTNQG